MKKLSIFILLILSINIAKADIFDEMLEKGVVIRYEGKILYDEDLISIFTDYKYAESRLKGGDNYHQAFREDSEKDWAYFDAWIRGSIVTHTIATGEESEEVKIIKEGTWAPVAEANEENTLKYDLAEQYYKLAVDNGDNYAQPYLEALYRRLGK